jgi:hypothetical protein
MKAESRNFRFHPSAFILVSRAPRIWTFLNSLKSGFSTTGSSSIRRALYRKFETLSLAKEISPVGKGVNRMWCLLAVQLAATFAVDS